MRTAFAIVTALALTFGAFTLAQGDEAAGGAAAAEVSVKAFQALQARVEALQAEVGYLRSRESALTAYVLQNEKRARGLSDVVARARTAGFEARTIPAASRKILMDGLLGAAKSFQTGLPRVSPDEAKMVKAIAKLRSAAGMDG